MPKRDWELIRVLVTALGRTNTPRTLPRVIGEALAPRWGARRVRLQLAVAGSTEIHEAICAGGTWTAKHRSAANRRWKRNRVPSLSVTKTSTHIALPLVLGNDIGALEIWCGISEPILNDSTYLETLVRLAEVGLDQQRLVKRVADLSRRAHMENRELRDSLAKLNGTSPIVARSPQMQDVMDRVAMVAGYDTSVLIQGPSGTGKELISREIHRRSSRSRKTFHQVNCGAIPSQLIESELFGHEEGAFTGATRSHRGVFEQAHGGVLLLDEVGDLPADAQVKLLRVLQEGRIRRVGGESEIEVNVRVVAATNRPLAQMVRDGGFREDLYFRLNVFPIEIPPLCERVDDIAPLVRLLLSQLSLKLGTTIPQVPQAVLSQLKAHAWPGNTRELANVLETAIILGRGRSLELPNDFGADASRSNGLPVVAPTRLDDVIREAIENTLRSTRGKIYGKDGAATLLGLHPATLQSKMRKLRIERQCFVAAPNPAP